MLDAAVKALSQMFSPPFRTVLLKSIGLALLLIVLIGIGLNRLLVWLASAGEGWAESLLGATAHVPLAILAWILSIAAALGIVVGSVFLMPAVTALVASFFVDEIALEVERSHYPNEPVGTALPLLRAVIEGVKTALLAVLVYLGGGAVPAGRRIRRGDLLPRHRLPARPRIFRARRHALPPAGGGQAPAQAAPGHGLRRRHVHRRLRVDPDRQSRDAAVRHGVHGAHAQAASRPRSWRDRAYHAA